MLASCHQTPFLGSKYAKIIASVVAEDKGKDGKGGD